MNMELLFRLAGGILAGAGGWQAASSLAGLPRESPATAWALLAISGGSFGMAFLLAPYATTRPFFWLRYHIASSSGSDIVLAAVALLLSQLVAALAVVPISYIPFEQARFLPVVTSGVLAYLFVQGALTHRRELMGLFGLPRRMAPIGQSSSSGPVLLDTSAIIDGRIADVSQTGFIGATVLIPRFVLDELQRIADSADTLRRNRGRRGLEMLSKLQKESGVKVDIYDAEVPGNSDVDGKLVRLAKMIDSPIVTTDYNLNKVAGLQGIKVLNINELANAVRAIVLPGEDLRVQIIQEGKEAGQGVGYMEDGTMVVVENGRKHVGSEVEVNVVRVLQTVAGRMVFAQIKPGNERRN